MAKAPKPGRTNPPSRDADAGDRVVTVRGVAATIRTGDYGPRDDALVRRETKKALGYNLSLMGALQQLDEESMGLDSICLLWWLARRKSGETTESFGDALDGFPTYDEFDEIMFEEVVDDPEEEGSPEASGGPSDGTGPPSPSTSDSTPGTSNG